MATIQENPDTDEIIWDRKGANGSIRVAVGVRDTVLLANVYDRTKEFSQREKEVKDLSEDQILQKKKALLMDHDKNQDMDAKAIGAGMVKAVGQGTAGNSFMANTYDIDVEKLAGSNAAESDEAFPPPEDPEPEESDVPQPAPKKGKGYWDRDTAIASKVRAETTALCTLEMQLKTKLDESKAQLAEITKRTSLCASQVAVEKETLLRRVEFLEAVLSEDSSVLDRLKTSVVSETEPKQGEKGLERSPTKDSESTLWTAQMAKAPPCSLYLFQ